MKYLDEFHDPELAARLFADIERSITRPWAIMEVCGGQTHTLIRYGIDECAPAFANRRTIPVRVQVALIQTPGKTIDHERRAARFRNRISFGR